MIFIKTSSNTSMEENNNKSQLILLATVGMPGSGKSETAQYIEQKGYSLVRFGDATDEGLQEKGLPITPENEASFREQLRNEFGMEAYAKKAEPKIKELTQGTTKIIIDGLYSWEEYKYLLSQFPMIKLLHVYANPDLRYERLSSRPVRPFTKEEALRRDTSEIEKLNKGGPIAMANFVVVNEGELSVLFEQIDSLLANLERRNS